MVFEVIESKLKGSVCCGNCVRVVPLCFVSISHFHEIDIYTHFLVSRHTIPQVDGFEKRIVLCKKGSPGGVEFIRKLFSASAYAVGAIVAY